MSKFFRPTNEIHPTNAAVVQLEKEGKRFEIACCKNKVLYWRNNCEKGIDEVLQTNTIFTTVSKGQAAEMDELLKCFGKSNETAICKKILANGELQVSKNEVDEQLNNIVTNVTTLCVNPETRFPYPTTIIEKSLRDAHFSVNFNKDTKEQTLEAIKLLREHMPIERCRMKLRVTFDRKDGTLKLRESIYKLASKFESDEWKNFTIQLVFLIEPGQYRVIVELVRTETMGKGLVELLGLIEVLESKDIF